MTTPPCEPVRRRLALGETREPDDPAHLASCSGCREEGSALAVLLRELGRDAVVAPPATVDAAVRRVLAIPAILQPMPRRTLAVGLAGGSMLALLAGIGSALAETGAAEDGLFFAVASVLTYLTICTAAALPVVMRRTGLAVVEEKR